jgi:hypothetical protein
MPKWNFDDKASTLTFSAPTRPSIIADVRLVGSYSTKTSTSAGSCFFRTSGTRTERGRRTPSRRIENARLAPIWQQCAQPNRQFRIAAREGNGMIAAQRLSVPNAVWPGLSD